MAGGVKLGSAFYDFGVNATGLVQGTNSVLSALSGFAAKATASYAKTAQSAREFSKQAADVAVKLDAQRDSVMKVGEQIDKLDKAIQASTQSWTQNAQAASKSQAVILSYQKQLDAIDAQEKKFGPKVMAAVPQLAQQFAAQRQTLNAAIAAEQQQLDAYTVSIGKAQFEVAAYEQQKKSLEVREQAEAQTLNKLSQQYATITAQIPATSRLTGVLASANTAFRTTTTVLQGANSGMNVMMRTVDRLTASWRGLSPQMQRAREEVYQAEAASATNQAKIQQHLIATAELRRKVAAAEQEAAHRKTQIQHQEELVEKARLRMLEQEQYIAQNAAKWSSAHTATQIQELQVRKATMQNREAIVNEMIAFGKVEDQRFEKDRANLERSVAYDNQLKERQEQLNQRIRLAKDAVSNLATTEKERAKAHKTASDSTDKAAQKLNFFQRIVLGIIGPVANFNVSSKNMITNIQQMGFAGQQGSSGLGRMASALGNIAQFAVGNLLGNLFSNLAMGMRQAIGTGVETYKTFEMLTLSMESMARAELVNSGMDEAKAIKAAGDMARENLRWLQDLAIISPFSREDIQNAFQLGQALGFTSTQTRRVTEAVVNWASATGRSGQEQEQVVRALGQMHANQKATLEDLNQLTNAGIGWQRILEQEFRPELEKTGKGIRDLISQGIVPADRAIEAIVGKFENDFPNGAKDSANSLMGLSNSLSDLANDSMRELVSATVAAVQGPMGDLVSMLQDPAVIAGIRNFGQMLGTFVGGMINQLPAMFDAVVSAIDTFGPTVMDALATLQAAADEAYGWGVNIAEQFANGISTAIDYLYSVINQISETLAYWMAPGSPPRFLPNIDKWGKGTAEAYFEGWSDADLGVLDSLSRSVQQHLGTLVGAGEIDSGKASGAMGTINDSLRRAIEGFRTGVDLTDQTLQEMKTALGSNSDAFDDYATKLLAVAKAQTQVNAVTQQYDERLKPLYDRLAKIRAAQDKNERSKQLQAVKDKLQFANPAGFEMDKKSLQLQADQLDVEQQIADLESERDTKLDPKQKELELANQQLATTEAMANAQARQNELVEKQITATDRLSSAMNTQADAEQRKAEAEEQRRKDAEFDLAMQSTDTAGKVSLLEEKLSTLDEGSLEYLKTKQELVKWQDQYQKELEKEDSAVKKLSDSEFEAALAGMTRAEKIKALSERLSTLDENSKEYYDTLKKLNALELQEEQAAAKAGGGGGAGKGGPMLANRDLAGQAAKINDVIPPWMRGVSGAESPFTRLQRQFANFADTVEAKRGQVVAFFEDLKQRLQWFLDKIQPAIPVLSVLAGFFLVRGALLMGLMRFAPLLTGLGVAIAGLLTPLNLFILAIGGLFLAFQNNFLGMRDAWESIAPTVKSIGDALKPVLDMLLAGDFAGGLSRLQAIAPDILEALGNIFDYIKGNLGESIGSLGSVIGGLFDQAFTWVKENVGTWLQAGRGLLDTIITALFGGDRTGGDWSSNSKSFSTGLAPQLIAMVQGALAALDEWFNGEGFGNMTRVMGTMVAAAGMGLLTLVSTFGANLVIWLSESLGAIVPKLPVILGALVTAFFGALNMLFQVTIPAMAPKLIELVQTMLKTFQQRFPEFMFNLGRLFGQIVSNLFIFLSGVIGRLIIWLQSQGINNFNDLLMHIGQWLLTDGKDMLFGLVDGLLRGMIGFLGGLFAGLLDPIIDTFKVWVASADLAQALEDVSNGMLDGLAKGIRDGIPQWVTDFIGWFDWAINAFKEWLGIASPSTKFIEIATEMVAGLTQGITNAMPEWVKQTVQRIKDFAGETERWFKSLYEKAERIWNDLKAKILTYVRDMVMEVLSKIRDLYLDALSRFNQIRDLSGKVNELKSQVLDYLKQLWEKASEWFEKVKKDITEQVDAVVNFLEHLDLQHIADMAWKLGETIGENIRKALETWYNDMKDWWNSILASLTNQKNEAEAQAREGERSGRSNAGSSSSSEGTTVSGGNDRDLVQLPQEGRRAYGGFRTANTMGWVGELGKPELFIPGVNGMVVSSKQLESLLYSMLSTSRDALGMLGIGSSDIAVMQLASLLRGTGSGNVANYNLTLNSVQPSRGIINDFSTMKALRRV